MALGSDRPGVTVIIPCHDEEASIGPVVAGCRGALAAWPHEVLVVDDGSLDDTAARAVEAGARVLRLSPNRGKGRALAAGVEAARHPVVVFLDGDGQDAPGDLPRLLDAFTGSVRMVIGSRFLGTLHPRSIHPLNRLANQAFSRLISVLFQTRISDSQAGYRVVRRDDYLGLRAGASEYEIETDVLLKALKAGWEVREVPVERFPRAGSATDFHRVRHGLRILWTIIRERGTR